MHHTHVNAFAERQTQNAECGFVPAMHHFDACNVRNVLISETSAANAANDDVCVGGTRVSLVMLLLLLQLAFAIRRVCTRRYCTQL